MKKTFRLTALILALLMLVNISASATTTGITLNELDIATYTRMFQSASQAAQESETMEGPVLSAPCSADNQYCVLLSQLVELPTAQDRYNFMKDLYSEDGSDVTLEGVLLHYVYYGDEHNAAGKICECNVPAFAPEYEPGALKVHDEECPWTFANLSVAEQYNKICLMTADEGAPYLATLNPAQVTALETYAAQQEEGKLSYPCEEKPEYCLFSEYSQMTASELYDYFNTMYAEDGNGEMSVRYGAVMIHYAEYHLDSNLICTCGEHPLPLPQYQVGDIDIHEADCPWHFANLTVPEQYGMVRMMAAPKKDLYMATLSSDKKSALEAYIDAMTSEGECDGVDCGYQMIQQMNGFDRYNKLVEWMNTKDENGKPLYALFTEHLLKSHQQATEICMCTNFQSNYANLGYGSINHNKNGALGWDEQPTECPWEFKYLSVEDQATVLAGLSAEDQAVYTASGLSQEQYNALMEYMNSIKDSSQEVTDKVEKDTETGSELDITIPANTFGENVRFAMKAAVTQLQETVKEAVEKLVQGHALAIYDISFRDIATGAELQPVNGKVTLKFVIDTAKVIGSHIQVYHLAETRKADGSVTYTPEAVGSPVAVDPSKAQQEITVEASTFSFYMASGLCDGISCKSITAADAAAANEPKPYIDSGDHNFAAMQGMTYTQMQQYINQLYNAEGDGTTVDNTDNSIIYFVMHLATYHTEWAMENICSCNKYPLPAPGAEHNKDCPWYESQLPQKENVSDTVENTDITVSVNGTFPEGVKLNVREAADEELAAYISSIPSIFRRLQLEINLMDANNQVWQHNGSMQVTISTSKLGETGDTIVLYRIHNGVVEFIGTTTVTDGSIIFNVDDFSYVMGVNVSDDCTDGADCGYAAFETKTIAEKEAALAALYNQGDEAYGHFEYHTFIAHVKAYHVEEANICLCDSYNPSTHAYGSLSHTGYQVMADKYPCPWHFSQIPVVDQAEILKDKTEEEREDYLETLSPEQKAELEAVLKLDEAGLLKYALIAKYSQEAIDAWFADIEPDPTVEMMKLALQAKSLQSVLILDGQLMYVYQGQAVATYDAETGIVTDIATGLTFPLEALMLTPDATQP